MEIAQPFFSQNKIYVSNLKHEYRLINFSSNIFLNKNQVIFKIFNKNVETQLKNKTTKKNANFFP